MSETLYEILGVSEIATSDEIKAAWRGAAKRLHPDVSQEDAAKFNRAKHAYDTLMDPERRRLYDETGESREQRAGPKHDKAKLMVLAIIEQTVKGIVNADNDDLTLINVPDRVLQAMLARNSEFRDKYREIDTRLARAQTLLERLSVVDGEEDPVRSILANGLQVMRGERKAVEEAEQAHLGAIQVWKCYAYKMDEGLWPEGLGPDDVRGLLQTPNSFRRVGGYRLRPPRPGSSEADGSDET